jgi:amino acid permease
LEVYAYNFFPLPSATQIQFSLQSPQLTSLPLVVLIVFIDGFIKPETPGSLREPAQTYLFPSNWLTLPISFGLLMSPWGGHAVFPNIYRDMRHPQKYKKALTVTFTFTVYSSFPLFLMNPSPNPHSPPSLTLPL